MLKQRLVQNSGETRGRKPSSKAEIKFPGPKYTTTSTNPMVNTNMIASPASSHSSGRKAKMSSSSSSSEEDDAEPMDYS